MIRAAPLMKGDPVWYEQAGPGGYGVAGRYIPARWLGASRKRVIVELELPDGSTRIVHVAPTHVSRRGIDQTVHPSEKERHA
jgi:hypothetical protein